MVVPTRKRRKRSFGCRRRAAFSFIAVVVVAVVTVASVWSIQHAYFSGSSRETTHRVAISRNQIPSDENGNTWIPPKQAVFTETEENDLGKTRYLIFRPPFEDAQGVGNLMNGLLAAHFLGNEFNRTVCPSTEWKDFDLAFKVLAAECQSIIPPMTARNRIWLLNYAKEPINECELKRRLQGKTRTIYLVANAYPRWPASSLKVNFEDFYRPTKGLQDILPWSSPPTAVVHLREADNSNDHRVGLDIPTGKALGAKLSDQTYLVTNQVAYYKFFQERFGWQHPPWTGVRHSALATVHWTMGKPVTHSTQMLQLWADWWTIYNAKDVYHTHSDFSRSAARWGGCFESFTIGRYNSSENALALTRDSWGDMGVVPLSRRNIENLYHCDVSSSLVHTMDLDDEMHDDHVIENPKEE